MPRVARETTCGHPKHYARGLCKACYEAQLEYDRASVHAKYNHSEKGKARNEAYDKSEAGRKRKREWIKKRREEQRKLREQAQAQQGEEQAIVTGTEPPCVRESA